MSRGRSSCAAISFFASEFYYAPGLGTPRRLPLPLNANLQGVLDGRAIFLLREPWQYREQAFAQGSVVAYDLQGGTAELVFAANPAQSVQTVGVGKSNLIVQYLDNVSGRAARIERDKSGKWQARAIALPDSGVLKVASAGGGTDDALLTFESLTTPLSLYFVAADNQAQRIFETPAAYDATDVVVEQRFATSRDGTKVPYFVMGRRSVLARGNAPTIQYAYGGFLSATLPVYYEDPSRPQHGALAGKLWVSRGGVLVLSNIRGGSEYGPAWHEAGLREHRQKVFDDFIAISEDLIRTGVTTPQKLGAIGRSNGGLLMGVVMNQRPDLYAAIVNGVPLLDMQRYTRLGAGASWVAEYGDPDTADWAYMSKWSPYQNLREGVAYPPVFYYTSTKDDRVHPAHARKAAARMQSLGRDYYLLREHRRRAWRHGEPGPARLPHRARVHLLRAAPDGRRAVERQPAAARPTRSPGFPSHRADAPPAVRARALRSRRKLHWRSLHRRAGRLARRCRPALPRSR